MAESQPILFMQIRILRMILYDESTKMWWDDPSAIVEEYKNQRKGILNEH